MSRCVDESIDITATIEIDVSNQAGNTDNEQSSAKNNTVGVNNDSCSANKTCI